MKWLQKIQSFGKAILHDFTLRFRWYFGTRDVKATVGNDNVTIHGGDIESAVVNNYIVLNVIEDAGKHAPDGKISIKDLKELVNLASLNTRLASGQIAKAQLDKFLEANVRRPRGARSLFEINVYDCPNKKEEEDENETDGARLFADAAVDYRPVRMPDDEPGRRGDPGDGGAPGKKG